MDQTVAGLAASLGGEPTYLLGVIRDSDPETDSLSGRKRTSRWRDVRAGRLPAPLKLGPNARGWTRFTLICAYHRCGLDGDTH